MCSYFEVDGEIVKKLMTGGGQPVGSHALFALGLIFQAANLNEASNSLFLEEIPDFPLLTQAGERQVDALVRPTLLQGAA